MRLRDVGHGDIVLVNRRGRIFHALVRGQAQTGELQLEPLDKRITYRSATAREVVSHWSRQGRPEPRDGRGSAAQLSLEDLPGPG